MDNSSMSTPGIDADPDDAPTEGAPSASANMNVLTGGNRDSDLANLTGVTRVHGIVGGRGETGGGSNANMGGSAGMTTAGTPGGTTQAATTDDLGGSDMGMTGDLSATTAGPEGDMGDLSDQMDAAVTAGAPIGDVGDTFAENSVADVTDRSTT